MTRAPVLAVLLVLAAAPPEDEPPGSAAAVVVALGGGLQAHRPAARARAATTLRALAARPMAGEVDWAARWGGRRAPAYRDRALGPAYRVLTLVPGGRLHLDQTFLAGQPAQVAAMAQPALAFDLDVALDRATVRCGAAGRRKVCDWVPDYTARYAIDLVSRGAVPATFVVAVQ